MVDWIFRLQDPKKYRTLYDNIEFMQSFTKNVIVKRRNILQNKLREEGELNKKNNDEDEFIGKKRAALLDVLLQATVDGEPLSDEDIREEVETFMFEGHDTTTSGISFTLYLISRHAEVQQRLFQEIRDIIGDDKQRPVTLHDLNDLQYMECVVKESLRLYPPVPYVGRNLHTDAEINGKMFPAGTNYGISIYHVLHDPDNFKNPHVFNPDRFSADTDENIQSFSFIPFSAGPRNCIGQKFAMLEMKSTISKLLRHFELLPIGDDPIISSSLTLKSVNGINMGLRSRIYEN